MGSGLRISGLDLDLAPNFHRPISTKLGGGTSNRSIVQSRPGTVQIAAGQSRGTSEARVRYLARKSCYRLSGRSGGGASPGSRVSVALGWLRGEPGHCSMVRVPTIAEEDAKRPNRERECLVAERTRIVNRMKATLAG